MNIVILGHVCIDRNESENASYITAGSPTVFISKIYNQLHDAKTTIIAPYGQDFLEFKKDLPLIEQNKMPEKTLVYENVSNNHTRTQRALNRECANAPFLTKEEKEILIDTDILFLAPLLPNFSQKYLKDVFENLKQECLKVLLPQGYYRNFDPENNVVPREFEEEEIISMFDLIIVSDQDGENMLKTAKGWSEKYGILVVVTTGKDGAVAITNGGSINLPGRTVADEEIVDTVGSGDIFSAAFAYKYYLTRNIEQSGKFANEIARQCLFFTPENIKINLAALEIPLHD